MDDTYPQLILCFLFIVFVIFTEGWDLDIPKSIIYLHMS